MYSVSSRLLAGLGWTACLQVQTHHPPPLPRQPTGTPGALFASTITTSSARLTPPCGAAPPPRARLGALGHELREPEIAPGGLAAQRRGLLDAKGGVLVGHDVVLVLWVHRLVVRGHVDVVGGEAVLGKGLEEVGVARAMQVERGEVGVLVLVGRRVWPALVAFVERKGLDLLPARFGMRWLLGYIVWE